MTNPFLARAKRYVLELHCSSCRRTFSPSLYEIDDRLILDGCCSKCRSEVEGDRRPEPRARVPRLFDRLAGEGR
jgi:hypothetical protein